MEMTMGGQSRAVATPLKSWRLAPRTIGKRTYTGKCVIAEAMHVTYQQQSTTFGRTAGVFGVGVNGDSFVTGGGGFVDTSHTGVVTVVFRDEDGAEQTHELPAAVAARDGAITRLDMIDTTVIGATNLSGKGLRLQLMDASAFIPVPVMSTFEVILGVIGVLMVLSGLGSFDVSLAGWGLIISGIPAYKLWRMQKARSERRELNGYIGEVFGQTCGRVY